jgi:hypothetical protein
MDCVSAACLALAVWVLLTFPAELIEDAFCHLQVCD